VEAPANTLRERAVGELRAIARAARTASVADSRSALRRARALWDLFEGGLTDGAYRRGRDALRETHHSLSWAQHDGRSAALLESIATSDGDKATAKLVLANAATMVPPTAEVTKQLEQAAACVDEQAGVAQQVIEQLEVEDLVGGTTAAYERARKRLGTTKDSRSDFHAWRRRMKELVYQLEFVGVPELVAQFDDVMKTSALVVANIKLRELVKTNAHGVSSDALEALIEAIDRPYKELRSVARDAGKLAFADKPKKFAKRVAKALKAS